MLSQGMWRPYRFLLPPRDDARSAPYRPDHGAGHGDEGADRKAIIWPSSPPNEETYDNEGACRVCDHERRHGAFPAQRRPEDHHQFDVTATEPSSADKREQKGKAAGDHDTEK